MAVPETPTTEAPKVPKVEGKTSPEFTGVGVGTLRAWHAYWANEARSKDDPALEKRPRATHLKMIADELAARGKPLS